jgi:hypothetical protein
MWNPDTFHTDKPNTIPMVPTIINHTLLDLQWQLIATKTETYPYGVKISCLSRDSSVLRSQLCKCSVVNQKHSFRPPTGQRSLTPSTRWPWGQNTLQYPHETKLSLRNGGNCNGSDVTGANKITKKPNNETRSAACWLIYSTQNNEFAEINLRGLLLCKKRMRKSYVRTNTLLAKVHAWISTDHTVPNRERWMTAMEGRYLGLRRSGPVWRVN